MQGFGERDYELKLLAIAALLVPSIVSGQVVRLDAGTSNTYGSGAQLTYYEPGQIITAGIGYDNGLIGGISDQFKFHGFDAVAGQSVIGLSSEGGGVGVGLSGLALSTHTDSSSLEVFAGSTGISFRNAYTFGTVPQHVGAGIAAQHQFQNRFGRLSLSGLTALSGGQRFVSGGARYRSRWASASLGCELLDKSSFCNLSASAILLQHITLLAIHQSLFLPTAASISTAGAAFTSKHFSLQGTASETALGVGESATVVMSVSALHVQSQWLKDRNGAMLVHSVSEQFHHLTITELVTDARGRYDYGIAGGYRSNKFSVSLTRSYQFMLSGVYAETTSVSFSVRLPHDLVLAADSTVDPAGKTRYTASVDTYAHYNHEKEATSAGKILLTGECVTADGKGVDGCVVLFIEGKKQYEVVSDGDGEFKFAHKHDRAAKLIADASKFVTAGAYEVVQCPEEALPKVPFKLVVRRKQ
jgi:hypothetical protein